MLALGAAAQPFGEEELAICALLKNKQDRLIAGINIKPIVPLRVRGKPA